MNDLRQLLQILIPVVGILLILLASITLVIAMGPALVPMAILLVIIVLVGVWQKFK